MLGTTRYYLYQYCVYSPTQVDVTHHPRQFVTIHTLLAVFFCNLLMHVFHIAQMLGSVVEWRNLISGEKLHWSQVWLKSRVFQTAWSLMQAAIPLSHLNNIKMFNIIFRGCHHKHMILLQEKNCTGQRWDQNPSACRQYGHCYRRAKPLSHLDKIKMYNVIFKHCYHKHMFPI